MSRRVIVFAGAGQDYTLGNNDLRKACKRSGALYVRNWLLREHFQAWIISKILDDPDMYPDGLLLVGYSRGAITALNVAKRLIHNNDIKMILLDPVPLFGFPHIYPTIPAIAFYQRNPTDRRFGIFSGSAVNPYMGHPVTSAVNFDYTGLPNVNHNNIVRYVMTQPEFTQFDEWCRVIK